jgi:hypothetical protein
MDTKNVVVAQTPHRPATTSPIAERDASGVSRRTCAPQRGHSAWPASKMTRSTRVVPRIAMPDRIATPSVDGGGVAVVKALSPRDGISRTSD